MKLSYLRKEITVNYLKILSLLCQDDRQLDFQDRINITFRVIDKMAWVKNGLGVQVYSSAS